jgi:hypothetical protein
MGSDGCRGEFEEGVPRLLFNPLGLPLLLRRIFDLGGREEAQRGFAPLRAPCVIPAELVLVKTGSGNP